MDASIFVRQPNAKEYSSLGTKKFTALLRIDEFLSAEGEGGKRHFQIVAIHHATENGSIEVYAVQCEPTWEIKKSRAIGFGH